MTKRSSLGELLKAAMDAQRWTARALADELDITHGTLGNYLSDKVQRPDARLLLKIGEKLGLDVTALVYAADGREYNKDTGILDPDLALFFWLSGV